MVKGLEAQYVVKVGGTGHVRPKEEKAGVRHGSVLSGPVAGKRCGGQGKEEQEFPDPKGPSAVGQAASWNEGSSVAGGFQARIGSHLTGIV